MAKMPRMPSGWNEFVPTLRERRDPDSDAAMGSGGLLDGWQSPDWSPAHSGLGFLLQPIAQIDFGASSPVQAPASIADRLAQERKAFFPQDFNMGEENAYQIAQAGGPLPYPLRQVPIPRFTPNRIPGYNTERMEADGNVYDHLAEPSEIRGAMLDLAARGRQIQVGKDYELDKNYRDRPMLVDKNTKFWQAPDSFPLVGWRGNTYKTARERYYIDRNGDGTVDVKLYQDPKSNVTMINYGDGSGFQPYDPRRVLPPPYVAPPPISPRHK